MFAALVQGEGQEVARGGRYDDIGRAFGSSRSATGFSTDLKTLVRLARPAGARVQEPIVAPWDADVSLRQAVAELRAQGERVVMRLPGTGNNGATSDRRQLVKRSGKWIVASDERDV